MEGFSILGRDPPSQHRPYPTIPAAELAEAAYEKSSDSSPWLLPSFAQRIRGRIAGASPPAHLPPSVSRYFWRKALTMPGDNGVARNPRSTRQYRSHTAFRDIESHHIHASAALVSCHPRSCPAIPSHIRPCSLYAPGHTEAHREYEHQEYEKAAMRCMAALAWRILRESVSGEPGRLVTIRLHSAR